MASTQTVSTPEADDTSLTGFFQDMNPRERRTFWACFLGWALDAMDFMIYPLVIGTIIAMWQVERGTAGLAVTVTLVVSALGGWLAGYLSDRIGRVRTLQITILWFSLFTLLCAFAQNFEQLMVLRAFLGLGFGGEWAAGAVLIGETIRAKYRGRAVGTVQSGWAVGWGAAVLLQAVCYSYIPPEQAWRWMFALGALPALLLFFLRRYVEEPEISSAVRKADEKKQDRPSILEIFSPDVLRITLFTSLLCTGAQGGYYAITTWLPTFLRTERGLTVVGSTGYLALLIVGSFIGYVWGAYLADRIGRRKLFMVFAVLASLLVVAYTQLPISNQWMLFLGFPLGICASAYFSGIGAFLTELFPTRLRGSGQGFAYNFGRGIGALFPALVGYLSAAMPLSKAIAIFAVIAYGLLLIGALLLPETRGKELHVHD
ncbi:MFS transporter [Tardiphaga sp.]|jgi:MFS family permease|uniref:MFS transporter n=1 Tax=Tardiphaga sp. TaxID=1926292 RepID=UPI0037D9A0EE